MKSFKLNKILLAFPALALAFGCLLVSGKTSTANVVSADEDASYYFESIGVDIEVTRNKQAIVTETLEAVWTKSRTSLIRDIQRVSATTRIVDGKEIKGKDYYAGISDISVKLDGGKCDWSIIGKDDDFYLSDFYSIEMKKPDGTTLERDV